MNKVIIVKVQLIASKVVTIIDYLGLCKENCCSHIREGWDTHVKYAFAPSAVNCRGI